MLGKGAEVVYVPFWEAQVGQQTYSRGCDHSLFAIAAALLRAGRHVLLLLRIFAEYPPSRSKEPTRFLLQPEAGVMQHSHPLRAAFLGPHLLLTSSDHLPAAVHSYPYATP